MNRLFFALTFIFITSTALFAEKITVPVNAEETGHNQPVDITVEWNDNWFSTYSPFEYHHDVARIAAILSEVSYVDLENDPNLYLLKNTYRKLGVKDNLIETHYDIDYKAPGLGINQAAFSFASKTITSSQGTRTLVFVTIRGTPFSAPEWISNVNVSDSTRSDTLIHEGFFRTENIIHNALIYYLLKNKIDPDTASFLITGHSRGAALSNLLGARLCDEGYFKTGNLFVYTFAAPNVSQEEKVFDKKYNFIWNIVNPEDVVPTVPMNRNRWHFAKYGQTKVIVNYWDTDSESFENDYIPRMNEYYKQFLHRDYHPFKTGTYIPTLITAVMTGLYPKIKDYYTPPLGLRNKTDKIFYDLYPETKPTEEELKKAKKPTVFDKIGDSLNNTTGGFLTYSEFAFFDMHASSMYLSWMLALDENELFTETPSSRILINGSYDCAVFDEYGQIVTKIVDGLPEIKSIKTPVLSVPSPHGVVIGIPSSHNYTIAVYKDSLIPTPISVCIQHFDAKGFLTDITPKQRLYPHKGIIYTFSAGNQTLTENEISATKLHGKAGNELIKNGKLRQRQVFRIQPELALDTELDVELGCRFGTRAIHGSVLTGQTFTDFGHALKLDLGFGHDETFIGPTIFTLDLYSNLIWNIDKDIDDDDKRFNIVPSTRFSLAFKPFRRGTTFISGVFDFHISDFNDAAFDSNVRNKHLGSITLNDDVEVIPSFRLGFRF